MNQKVTTFYYKKTPYIFKPVPDGDTPGMIDPRLFAQSKVHHWMLNLLPEKILSYDLASLGVEKARIVFDSVKSKDITNTDILKKKYNIPTRDGKNIAIYHYQQIETSSKVPTLIYIHGGGFFAGHPGIINDALKYMCQQFAFNIFSIDYRLAPEHPYPTSHHDCYDALNWIDTHKQKLRLHPEQLFIAGDSAGGNLAQYCITQDIEQNLQRIKAQLLLYPSLNMAGIKNKYFDWDLKYYQMEPNQEKTLAKMIQLFGALTKGMPLVLKVNEKEVKTDTLNPFTKKDLSNMPPTFLAVGEHDFFKIEALGYAMRLQEAKRETKVIVYGGMNHAFFDNFGVFPQAEDCALEMGKFILEISKQT